MTGDEIAKPCSCTRKCEHRTFSQRIIGLHYGNQTVIKIAYDDPHETLIREHISYDLISLLNDLGGNSGLYIGLSLLSVFHFMTLMAVAVRRVKQQNHTLFTKDDPLYMKVIKTYNTTKGTTNPVIDWKGTKREKIRTSLHLITVLFCTLIWGYCAANRICYFLEFPTKTVVDVSFNSTLETPSITMCTGNTRVMKLQKMLAQRENISNFCDIRLWKLIDLQDATDAERIWVRLKVSLLYYY